MKDLNANGRSEGRGARSLGAALLLATFALAFWLGARYGSTSVDRDAVSDQAQLLEAIDRPLAAYSCDDGKSVWARLLVDGASLALSDGRRIELAHAASGEESRYALADGSIIFAVDGETASLVENGTTTYSDCKRDEI